MGSSKLSRLPGFCNQCAAAFTTIGMAVNKDFGELPVAFRDVHCYGCGDITVNQAGDCTTKCEEHHNYTLWDKFKFRAFGITP